MYGRTYDGYSADTPDYLFAEVFSDAGSAEVDGSLMSGTPDDARVLWDATLVQRSQRPAATLEAAPWERPRRAGCPAAAEFAARLCPRQILGMPTARMR